MRKYNWTGFAEIFLWRCKQESKTLDKKDIELYIMLIELDKRLGTTATDQLFGCLLRTTRWDIIKVRTYTKYE